MVNLLTRWRRQRGPARNGIAGASEDHAHARNPTRIVRSERQFRHRTTDRAHGGSPLARQQAPQEGRRGERIEVEQLVRLGLAAPTPGRREERQ